MIPIPGPIPVSGTSGPPGWMCGRDAPPGEARMDSLSRHEQVLRVFHLIDILFGARQPLTTAELKERLIARGVIDEMSEKNLRRDVQFLAKFGYALERSRKRTPRGTTCDAWAIRPGRGAEELTPPAITLPELLSLAVAREFLAPLAGTLYWRGIGQLLAKLEQVATPELVAYATAHRDGLVVHPRPMTGKYRPQNLNAIHRAIHHRLELELDYMSLGDGTPRRIVVRPESLVLYEGAVYIAATRGPTGRTAASPGIRFFKLDRVTNPRATPRAFTPQGVPVDALLADSITMFRSPDPPRRYRLRIDQPRARWAVEKPFHPGQRVREEADGSVILEIERAWDEEMIPQVLALGEHVEVLAPADIRERLAEMATRIAARHAPAIRRKAPRPAGRMTHAK